MGQVVNISGFMSNIASATITQLSHYSGKAATYNM